MGYSGLPGPAGATGWRSDMMMLSKVNVLRKCGAVLLLCLGLGAAAQERSGWNLVWSDEFNGTALDRSKWSYDTGDGFYSYDENKWISGWGNKELQYYTDASSNVFVEGGMLHLRAVKESYQGKGYTSGRITTMKRDGTELFAKTYGRFEFRAKLPTGQGIWPAMWMLPRDFKYGGWAASGEIDVVEARGQKPLEVNSTLHYGSQWDANAYSGGTHKFPDGHSIADFHVYAVEWEPGEIRFSVDGVVHHRQNDWWSSSRVEGAKGVHPKSAADLNAWPAPFDQPFFIIMNLAVGGDYLGNPDKTTKFPVEMLVDYVRVYDKTGGYGPPLPRGKPKLPFALTTSVNVMSFNIRCGSCEAPTDVNHWSRRKTLVADLIRKSQADLVGLQEAEAFQVRDLVALLPEFDWVGVGRDDGKLAGEMNAVLVRRTAFVLESQTTLFLSETPDKVSRGWDAALNRTLTLLALQSRQSGQKFHFLNTHFDHMGEVARVQSGKLIARTVAALGADARVILTGDLNGKPGFPGYLPLAHALRDTARVTQTPTTGGDLTFNGFGHDLQPGNTIDFVFVSPSLAVQAHGVLTDVVDGRYPSDHFPVLSRIELK